MATPPDARPRSDGALLTLHTLGVAALSRTPMNGDVEQLPVSGKQLALICFLACAPNRSAPRDDVIALLWGSADDSPNHKKADAAFRSTLVELRVKLGVDAFGVDGADPLPLALPIQCDRDLFHNAIAAGDDAAAAALYHGHFLARIRGLVAQPAPFAHWADGVRADVQREFVAVARRLAVAVGDARTAAPDLLALARQLHDLAEPDEQSWVAILTGLARAGRLDAARGAGARLHSLLHSLELEPSPNLADSLDRAGAPWIPAARRTSPPDRAGESSVALRNPPSLIGRDAELDACHRAWERARAGCIEHLHVVSPAGLGRTAFLEQLQESLRTRPGGGAWRKPLFVPATQGTRAIPYRFAAALAEELAKREGGLSVDTSHASALVALAPVLGKRYVGARRMPGPLEALHGRMAAALSALLAAVASEGPIAILLDDVHWSDEHSLRLFADAWPQGNGARLLLVSTATSSCESLCTRTHASLLQLAPLSVGDITTLLELSGRLPDQAWARELPALLHDLSDGSPYLVSEQLKLLLERRLLSTTGGSWRTKDSAGLLLALAERGATTRRLERLAPAPRELLLLLAVAGGPLSSSQLSGASDGAERAVASHMEALRSLALVTCIGDNWSLTHDSHASALLALTSDESIKRAAAAVGRVLATQVVDGGDDRPLYADHIRQLQHAASLLVAGNDEPSLSHVFRHTTARARATSDRRPNERLAEELLQSLGASASALAPPLGAKERLVPLLIRSLPWRLRHWIGIRRSAWGGIALAVAVGTLGVARWIVASSVAEPPPDAVLLASRQVAGDHVTRLQTVALRSSQWSPATPLVLAESGRDHSNLSQSIAETRQSRADANAWLVSRESGDSGGLDIFELTRSGSERRLTHSPGDDLSPAWAPDGARFVFSTARWNAMAQYDLASFDTLTGSVRQLTSGDDRDVIPHWSPDGSRIAFAREYWEGGSGICVIDADGGALHCLPQSRRRSARLHGWINTRELLVDERIDSTTWQLARVDVASGVEHPIVDDLTRLLALSLSPDGAWVACRCTSRSKSVLAWWIFPLDAPRDARALALPETDSGRVAVTWLPAGGPPPVIDRLRIRTGLGPAQLGTPYQLVAEGRTRADRVAEVGVVRWRTMDSTIARIDTAGIVHPLRVGQVHIEASAGGWRLDTIALAVVVDTPRTLFEERWEAGLTKRWVPFGDPRPIVVRDSVLGTAFFNNGDRLYFSGAYTADTFPVARGLWVEADLSTPIVPNSQWQQQLLTLLAGTDEGQLASWDHVKKDMTPGDCRVYFPGGEGAHLADTIFIQNPAPSARVPAPAWLRTGRAFRALVQIFPDGRCGFALDGQPLWVSPPAFRATSARAKIDGRSVGTRVLVGPLRVGTGVARQVRWGEVARR